MYSNARELSSGFNVNWIVLIKTKIPATSRTEFGTMYKIQADARTMNISDRMMHLNVIFLDLSANAAIIGCNRIEIIDDKERTMPIWVLSKFL
jgi:hypothetical protein